MENSVNPGVLLVTGGASGIGARVVQQAAAKGYPVAINWRTRREAADTLVEHIVASGGRALSVQADVSNAKTVSGMFDEIESDLGPVRGLVNSAGISIDKTPLAELDADAAEQLVRTNILGSIFPTQEAVRRMSTDGNGVGGVIVNVSSMAATIGGRSGSVTYAATKGAIDVFTKGLAREVAAQGIRVNAVRPGMTASEMTPDMDDAEKRAAIAATIPLGRIAEADEVASAIMWLLSDDASFVSGALLDISGGGFRIAGE